MEALAEVIFRSTSLEEALEALKREGYHNPAGSTIVAGIADLLEGMKALREQLSAAGSIKEQPAAEDSGPVKSGASRKRAGGRKSTRLIPESSTGKKPLRAPKGQQLVGDDLARLDLLEKTVRRVYWGYDPASVDEELLEKLLGSEALHNWQAIKELTATIFRQGLATAGTGSGLRLTHAALHKIARNILKNIFKPGRREPRARRDTSDLSTEPHLSTGVRPYRFGDPPLIEPTQSLLNAIRRTGARRPVKVGEEDLMVYDREPLSRYATVILLDLSRSMRFEDCYIAAKKVTLALLGLIERRYPRDRMSVVGFSTKAYAIQNFEIPFLTWDETNPYTNMEEALDLAHGILSKQKGFRRQLFLLTDGEPTAHRENGFLFFQFPPHPKTLAVTLKRLRSLSRSNIDISIFLLSREQERVRFAHLLAENCKGKVFHIQPGDLGRCLLMDYMEKKSRWL
ncbi:MAG: VWA domain-containing protein [Acidobacteria bacterium]|nr:VWA domain-containing protein [Acidobacteriota bacterium]